MEEKANPSWPSLPPNQRLEGTPACCARRRPSLAMLGVRYKRVLWLSLTINSQLVARRLKKLMCFANVLLAANMRTEKANLRAGFFQSVRIEAQR